MSIDPRHRLRQAYRHLPGLVIRHRALYLALIALMTFLLGMGLRNISITTVFPDLLPYDHPNVEIARAHPDFGNPMTVQILLKNKRGDIFDSELLAEVWRLTEAIDLVPGVDHDQVVSIASERARVTTATAFGVESRPLMADHSPGTPDEITAFRHRVATAPGIVGVLVSQDYKATLIQATFVEERLHYGDLIAHLTELKREANKIRHEIYITGLPVLIGWVHFYKSEMLGLFAITITVMLAALMLYTRNLAGIVTPVLVSAVSAIWAFGLVGWLGYNVEPLILVVPLLLVARSFSHCVQVTERYYEQLNLLGDPRSAAENALRMLLVPGTLGIVTDAAALLLIGIVPIPMMQKLALFCGFWALTLFPANVILSPIILSLLPKPRNLASIVDHSRGGAIHRAMRTTLARVAGITCGSGNMSMAVIFIVLAITGVYSVTKITVGNDSEGSTLLRQDSSYKRAIRALNAHFPGPNTLEIVFEGPAASAMRRGDVIHAMHRVQRMLESQSFEPRATLSIADYLPEVNRLFSGGNPKWLPLDRDDRKIDGLFNALFFGTNIQSYSHVVDLEMQYGTVKVWVKDLRSETLDRVISQATEAVTKVNMTDPAFHIRIGAGAVALQNAVNDRVVRYEWLVTLLLLLVILVTCSLAYGSILAGIILTAPVVTANLMLASCMVLFDISLDINTMPITAIAIGVGIDYGIYLLSRIREEARNGSLNADAATRSVTTTGKAIMFTASVVLIGLLPWYFFSSLRFQAEMGLLLSAAMLINMIIALLMIPTLVCLIGPRFIVKQT